MLKHRFLIAASALSIAAFGLSPLTYAREAQPNDDRGRHEIQANDDRGAQMQVDDDRGVDQLVEVQPGDDNGVDPQPDA